MFWLIAAECLGGIGSDPAERSALISSGVLAADVKRGAAIAVTVIGKRLNTGRHL